MAMTETKIRTLVPTCMMHEGEGKPLLKAKNGRYYWWKDFDKLNEEDQEKIRSLTKRRLRTIKDIAAWYGTPNKDMSFYREQGIIKPLIDYQDKPEDSLYWLNQAIVGILRYENLKKEGKKE